MGITPDVWEVAIPHYEEVYSPRRQHDTIKDIKDGIKATIHLQQYCKIS